MDTVYFDSKKFEIKEGKSGTGLGLYSKTTFKRGELLQLLEGRVQPYKNQHSVQIAASLHFIDYDFTGYLLHSCVPNAVLDLTALELWALRDISKEEGISIDYTMTEDTFFVQFPCLCNNVSQCRKWITGRKEKINEEGLLFLSK